ncbi:MAG TPA: hypothetical protein VK508_19220 [Cyclobacteriaceae bacterium]|nr:hypothetical protein [Cyclobacteriaceae bacterium]
MIKPSSIVVALLVLCVFSAKAQQTNDTTFVVAAKDNAVQFYTQTIGVQSRLFEGSDYKEYIAQRDEFPYLNDDVVYGSVKYAGEVYKNIPLYYDLEKDQVITSYPFGNKVQLLREKVEYFDIGGHKYVLLQNTKVQDGFYDLLYDGKMKFYVHRQKVPVLKVNSNGSEATRTFEERVKYFILKNGAFHTVRSKGSVMGLLKDKKKDLKKALRTEKVRFGQERERSITLLLKNYERIQ